MGGVKAVKEVKAWMQGAGTSQVAGRTVKSRYIYFLVGGFNPFEKYARQNGLIFPKYPNWDEHEKYLKPPSFCWADK